MFQICGVIRIWKKSLTPRWAKTPMSVTPRCQAHRGISFIHTNVLKLRSDFAVPFKWTNLIWGAWKFTNIFTEDKICLKFFTFSFMFFSILALGLKFEVSAQWGGGGGDYSISIIQWHQNIWNVFPIWDT